MAALLKFNFSTTTSKFTAKPLYLQVPLQPHIISLLPNSPVLQIHLPACLKMAKSHSKLELSASAADPIISEAQTPTNKEKLGVVVKPMEKPRIVLKVIKMQKAIGVGLDQAVPGFGTIPLTPYLFWRKEDAFEQLKFLLESKPWISYKQMHILLNQATHIFNLWPESGS